MSENAYFFVVVAEPFFEGLALRPLALGVVRPLQHIYFYFLIFFKKIKYVMGAF
jgi:hypothetical protein